MDVICLKETEEEAFTGGRAWLLLDRVATDWKGELERSERIIAPTRIQRLAVDFPYSPTDESLEVVGITASSGIEYLSQPSGVRVIDFREDWHVILGDLVYGLRQANSGINPAVDFAMDVFVENLALCLDNKKFDRKLMAQALKALIGTTGLPAEPIFKDTVPVKRLTVKSYKIDDTEFFGCAASLQRYKTGQPGLQHILLKDNETETEEQ
jgi:hypothetical protein